MSVTFTQEELYYFTGTEKYYRSSALFKDIVHTDGVQHIVSNGGAWMVDVITSYQLKTKIRACEFQAWNFQVDEIEHTCKAVCTSGDDESILAEQDIPYTDLNFSVQFFVELGSLDMVTPAWVILLPSEH